LSEIALDGRIVGIGLAAALLAVIRVLGADPAATLRTD
jgi:hypothetical protein